MAVYETRESLEPVLSRLAGYIKTDPAFLKRSKGQPITLAFDVTDLDVSFYVSLGNGQVDAGLGQPPQPPTLTLSTTSAVLNGLLSGQVNPILALMEGGIGLSGDVSALGRAQGMMDDFERLYKKAAGEEQGA